LTNEVPTALQNSVFTPLYVASLCDFLEPAIDLGDAIVSV